MMEIRKKLLNLIPILYLIIFVLVFLVIGFISHDDLKINNIFLLIISLGIFYGLYKCNLEIKHRTAIIICLIIAIVQVFVFYNIYFYTGWDSGEVLLPAARSLAQGKDIEMYSYYFNWADNNLYLLQIYRIIFLIANKLNLLYTNLDIFMIILLNILINILSIYLIYKTTYNLTHNLKIASFSFIVAIVLLGLSPWTTICYSDSFTLFCPILCIFLYSTNINKYLKLALIIFLSVMMSYVKPQNLIILIAIFIVEILNGDHKFKTISFSLIFLIIVFMMGNTLKQEMISRTSFTYDTEKSATIHHYLMMGLNKDSEGAFSEDDTNFSMSIPYKNQRIESNKEVIIGRIKDMGFGGLLNLAKEKSINNFNDGTFGWSKEGNFYLETFDEPMGSVSSFLRSFYYENGNLNILFKYLMQTIWIGCLFFQIFQIKVKNDNKMMVLLLSIIGITAFETIFECRARYIYIYVPLFIVVLSISYYRLIDYLKNYMANVHKTN